MLPASFGRQIRLLEEGLGRRLLQRTTRHVELTDAGREFVEAARELAQRVLAERPGASDAERLAEIFRRCTAREPDAAERAALAAALEDFRGSFAARPQDAAAFVDIGPLPRPADVDEAELAAWTTVASAVLNLHRTVTHP